MSAPAPVPVARVSAVHGQVFAKGENGALRPLRVGDFIYDNEAVITGDDGAVDLAATDGQASFSLGAGEVLTMDAEVTARSGPDVSDAGVRISGNEFDSIVTALAQGRNIDELLEETAAGAAGGDDAGGGPSFVRLLRISESVDPLNYQFETPLQGEIFDFISGGGGNGGTPEDDPEDKPVNAPPAIDVVDGNGNASGASSVPEDRTHSGYFTIDAPDGLDETAALTVDGTPVSKTDLESSGTTPITIPMNEGVLTLTGYDPATGEVSWSYNPAGESQDHSGGEVLDTIPITVKEADGDTASGNLVINITDTEPLARADSNSVTEDTTPSASGNVITTGPGADTLGADAPTTVTGVEAGTPASASGNVGGSVTGQYGTLVLGSDGSYTYTLANDNPAVQGLDDGQTLTDTFTYTLTD
ncbi:MAG: retention module-containing protein, partial [Candidatus Accumulibacter sp.]|nr:retention module-containing protein [Accumulibacter sp.]